MNIYWASQLFDWRNIQLFQPLNNFTILTSIKFEKNGFLGWFVYCKCCTVCKHFMNTVFRISLQLMFQPPLAQAQVSYFNFNIIFEQEVVHKWRHCFRAFMDDPQISWWKMWVLFGRFSSSQPKKMHLIEIWKSVRAGLMQFRNGTIFHLSNENKTTNKKL